MIEGILYKYRSWTNKRNVDILRKNEIYFASLISRSVIPSDQYSFRHLAEKNWQEA